MPVSRQGLIESCETESFSLSTMINRNVIISQSEVNALPQHSLLLPSQARHSSFVYVIASSPCGTASRQKLWRCIHRKCYKIFGRERYREGHDDRRESGELQMIMTLSVHCGCDGDRGWVASTTTYICLRCIGSVPKELWQVIFRGKSE